MIHDLKIWPQYYEAVLSGEKNFEVRENDRGFREGDDLALWEFGADLYTGRALTATITYVHSGLGMAPGYVVLGLGDMREVE